MIREITLGQYYQTDSKIHALDPRVKLVATMIYVISLFLFRKASPYLLAILFLAMVIKTSKVPFSYMVRGLKSIVFILMITAAFNIFLTSGEPVISFWALTITKEGIKNACFIAIRIILLIVGSSLMTLTTTPNQLTDGMENLMKPLSKVRVPVHEISMMMSIALRFIPILMEETDKIMKAQMARGADFETGGLIKKGKAMIPLLVPLFVSAFRRANDLAMAMEARCYHGGDGRTKMKPLKYKRIDLVGYCILAVYLAGIIIMGNLLPI